MTGVTRQAIQKMIAWVGRAAAVKLKGVVYDVGRAMGARSVNWRPDYSATLMHRALDIIRVDRHANAVHLGGRDPRRLLEAAEYAASIGLDLWIGPELWNARPRQTLRHVTESAAPSEPLFRRFGDQLTFCVGNELTFFMRDILPGRSLTQRTRAPNLREIVLSDQKTLRAFFADTAASVRPVYSGTISYAGLPIERVDWEHFGPAAGMQAPPKVLPLGDPGHPMETGSNSSTAEAPASAGHRE